MKTDTYSIEDFLSVRAAFKPAYTTNGRVVYQSNVSGTAQLYIIDTPGSAARQLTDYPDQILDYVASPTENKILFEKAEGGNEIGQLFILDVDTGVTELLTQDASVKCSMGTWSTDGRLISYSSNERNGKDFDVYVLDMVTRERACVYERGGRGHAIGFSPKGTYLTVQVFHTNVNADLYVCNLSDAQITHITPHDEDAMFLEPQWCLDEKSIFLCSNKEREFIGLARIHIQDATLTYVVTPEWGIESMVLSHDTKVAIVVINQDGYSKMLSYDTDLFTEKILMESTGTIADVVFSRNDTSIVYRNIDSRHAGDIFSLDLGSCKESRVTQSLQGVPPDVLVEPELIRFESFDGLSIPAFVYMPNNVAPGKKLPVIIDIHGGPESQYRPILAQRTQYLVYKGFAVVAPNIRGSDGYGKNYLSLDNIEKRMDAVKDIVALRDYLKTRPEFDVERIALVGGSYGGFVVLACMAFYPKLWAAGVDTVGIANFVTFLENTAPYRRANREAEYGSLEKDREFLASISPIHSIEKIEAPLFVIHGANDPRVPLSEAEQVVSKLKELGREVEFIVYPDEGHGLSKLKNRLDAYPKIFAFLEKILII